MNQMEEAASNSIAPAPKKMRFKPKIPTRRTPKPVEVKAEVKADAEAARTADLLKFIHPREGSRRHGPEIGRKSEPQAVTFGPTGKPTPLRKFERGNTSSSRQDNVLLHGKRKKEYVEPWNLYSYYPVTLPLRRPYSRNPVILDEEEFEDTTEGVEYDETSTSSAKELGLMEEFSGERMLFFQLPAALPLAKRSLSARGKEINDNSTRKVFDFEELPAGFMGKMLVYKSGAVKLKLGETLYDVSPGSDCVFAQNVAAINVEEKHCCVLGDLEKRLVVTPDIDSLL